MSKLKKMMVALAVVTALISGAVTVYAVAGSGEEAQPKAAAPAEYEAEEMAIGAYYADLTAA